MNHKTVEKQTFENLVYFYRNEILKFLNGEKNALTNREKRRLRKSKVLKYRNGVYSLYSKAKILLKSGVF